MSDDDRDGRRKRLWIILAIAAAAVIAVVTISIVGSRRVDSDAAEVRERAGSATIDPSTIVFEAYDVDDNAVADALGVDPTDVILSQNPSNQWCVQVEISHLTSSRSLHFDVDDSGVLSAQRSTAAERTATEQCILPGCGERDRTLDPAAARSHLSVVTPGGVVS